MLSAQILARRTKKSAGCKFKFDLHPLSGYFVSARGGAKAILKSERIPPEELKKELIIKTRVGSMFG